MRSCLSAAAALLMLGGLVSATRADTPLPDRWRKTMTSDPETNYFLRKYSESLPDQMETVVRSTILFRLLSVGCRGVSFDNSVMDTYVKNSGFFALPIETAKEASRLGAALFDYFDYEALAHLCAGSDYLFGPKGDPTNSDHLRVWLQRVDSGRCQRAQMRVPSPVAVPP